MCNSLHKEEKINNGNINNNNLNIIVYFVTTDRTSLEGDRQQSHEEILHLKTTHKFKPGVHIRAVLT